jgi:DNA-binding response OmpR family regulator
MAKKEVMVVDDEPSIVKVLEDILKTKGYKVVTAFDGDEALKKLAKSKPDLILIDFYLPTMSGRELCEKIRANSKLKDVKIAFLTAASFSPTGKKELKKLDVLDFIKKPFEYKDLLKRVNKIIK